MHLDESENRSISFKSISNEKALFRMSIIAALSAGVTTGYAAGDVNISGSALDDSVGKVEQRVIAWWRDIHHHPELSGQEAWTAALVADHLSVIQPTEGGCRKQPLLGAGEEELGRIDIYGVRTQTCSAK